ncbi:probable DBP3 - putative RNA helicase required for pre-rRNA processing [Melanopsichium pennsylvanicum]|uniref:RNA helicase n=2 Tax=Melanopsichium pennsylvanicum TaxID=63383 RepID=A0AAJ5C3Z4_9BASI|nr:probable DBP3-putative RNA helicase required for pre-rRNA processing [Melanopsichium pennsylvanicum 4]SNX83146.1 probable DBP3 - putative RNA helicase required for pre-rRNA processing [Melanopsichium pennsylvanicum]
MTTSTTEKALEDRAKSLHKKEKKAGAKAAAAAAASAEGSPSPASPAKKQKKDKKGKKDKKRSAEDDAAADDDDDKAAKKRRKEEKKAKKATAISVDSTPAATLAPVASTSAAAFTPTNSAAARAFLETHNITIEAPEESSERPPLPMVHFRELDGKIDAAVKKTLDTQGFTTPTPIQACCWPVLLQNKDVVGIAETGSGKTFAFGLPALQHLVTKHKVLNSDKKKGKGAQVNVLVVAPTRELAIQTEENMAKLGKSMGIGMICLYGGVSKQEQVRLLNQSPTVRIVVGTPGRVLDMARDGSLDLSGVTYLVLDEADRMLDKGFEPDIRAIIGLCKSREEGRHTSMFSATWPPAVRGLAESFMNAPVRVTVGSDELSANRRVEQSVEVLADGYAKERRLNDFLRSVNAQRSKDKILIFALYKKEAQRIEQTLRRGGFQVSGIHGDLGQHERIASLERFKTAETPLLVATDVAARGLDIPNVEHVVNYTFPLTIEDYVHRIGRTGRGGKTGKSLTFFTEMDKAHAGELIRVLKDADQKVPEDLTKFPTTIKKKTHSSYGDHFKELVAGKSKKIVFDDDD